MATVLPGTLPDHLTAVNNKDRMFENAFQGVARMILDAGLEKVTVNGKTIYDFNIFRAGSKHVIGMYDEINSFVSYVKDAAENGSSKEMAFVLVGEPAWDLGTVMENFPLIAFFPREMRSLLLKWIEENLTCWRVNASTKILNWQKNGLIHFL